MYWPFMVAMNCKDTNTREDGGPRVAHAEKADSTNRGIIQTGACHLKQLRVLCPQHRAVTMASKYI